MYANPPCDAHASARAKHVVPCWAKVHSAQGVDDATQYRTRMLNDVRLRRCDHHGEIVCVHVHAHINVVRVGVQVVKRCEKNQLLYEHTNATDWEDATTSKDNSREKIVPRGSPRRLIHI
eukprot:4490167-Pyramimonas_sp.AAC.1